MTKTVRLISVLFLGALLPGSGALSDGKGSKDRWFLCRNGPLITLVDKEVGRDGCSGSARIQGVLRKCVRSTNVTAMTRDFFLQLVSYASRECTAHCLNRGSGCKGTFVRPAKCGASIEPQDALATGKNVGCHDGCEGPALVYCSLYRSSNPGSSLSWGGKEAPNCFCKPSKR